jgi:tetratricopeptide (TPR) repeat protein
MIPPTSLPSWWTAQREVITAVSEQAAHGDMETRELAETVIERMESNKLPPEYAAEINAGTVGLKYFEVLRALDSETPNSVHFALAEMARSGRVRTILTTNFDQALEVAFRLRQVPLEVRFAPDHFIDIANHVGDIWAGAVPCQLIKLHGSAIAPNTIIDTLSQRKRGLPEAAVHVLESLLEHGHWLFLGYSGADLEAEPNYLSLRRMRDRAIGFSWLVREGSHPLPAVTQLVNAYGGRAKIRFGSLPQWLNPLVPTQGADSVPSKVIQSSSVMPDLAEHSRRWAHDLGWPMCALVLSRLLVGAGHPAQATTLALRIYKNHPLSQSKVFVEENDGGLHVVCVPLDGAPLAGTKVLTAELTAEGTKPVIVTGPFSSAEDPRATLFADVCSDLCTLTNVRGDYDLALDYARRVLIAAYIGDDTDRAASALGLVARIQERTGALAEADRTYGWALVVARSASLEQASLLNARAIVRGQRGEFGSAVADLRQSLKVYEVLGLEREQAAIYVNLANIEGRNGDVNIAAQQYEKAKNIFERLGDEYGRISVLIDLAALLRESNSLDRALNFYSEALLASELMQDARSKVKVLHGLAVTHDLRKDFITAEQSYRSAIGLAETISDRQEQASIHNNLARLFRDLGRSAETRKHRRIAADLYEQIGNPAKLAETIYSEGCDFLAESDPSAASSLFQDAWERFTHLGLARQALNALINLAESSLARGHSKDALKFYAALGEQPTGPRATELKLRSLVGRGNAFMQLSETDNAVASVVSAIEIVLKIHGPVEAARMTVDISGRWLRDFKAPRAAMTMLRGTRRLVENEHPEDGTNILDAYIRSLDGESRT